MRDEPLQRQEDQRYREIDRVIDKANADAGESPENDDDGARLNPPQSEDSDE